MKLIHSLLAMTALALVCFHTSAQKLQAPSLCAADEEPAFSCTLQGPSRKMVSLCASSTAAEGERRFHYLYGRSSKVELRYPSSGNSHETFTFTRLRYAGATSGYAHSFIKEGFKYIVYSVEGTGFKESGLLVQREGASRADREAHCRSSTLIKLKNNDLWNDTVSKWRVDPDIDAHGLPYAN